jgi:hypothetical protein
MARSKYTAEADETRHEALTLLREKMRIVAQQEGGKGAQILLEYAKLAHEIFVSSVLNDGELDRRDAEDDRAEPGAPRRDVDTDRPAHH